MAVKSPPILLLKGFLAFQILHELHKNSLCGDELADIIGGKKTSKLTPGTIYPTLKNLRNKKLLTRKKEGRRKVYSLTKIGEKEYKLFKEKFREVFREVYNKKI